ncbi:carbon-nitrogen family hydrolase [Nocardioides cavernaquae]|uniref:Carbon-nitrogen family hydrolase n=1 Tax=Nocardioides cavernaquae TaxID=2321396 RepID=A0A3A5HCL6_9ACTN|nr:carbon-nitrogen family hydrolase [Nocardioides cavernaquae]RJS45780.1 carbon-nitrogen family hydrolase [Nocardioides cavernaquae]
MHIALLQLASPDAETVADRLARVDGMVRAESALSGADFLVLPEMWTAGYFSFDEYAARAEPFEGPTLAAARGWARDLDLTVHLGSFVEVDAEGRLHNTSAVVHPDGEVSNVYRKVHLFGYGSRETQLLTPGESIGTSDINGLATGITTCYDLRFPELFRSLVDAGAEMAAVCAAWPEARLAHWRLFTTVRAVEQQMYVVAVNAVGEQAGVTLGGHSRVVDPTGQVVVEAGQDEGFTYADIDTELPRKVRAEFPALADRRWSAPQSSGTQSATTVLKNTKESA